MKNSILKIAAGICITGALLTGCSTPAQRVQNAQDNVNDAEKDLETAKRDYREDMKVYREEVAIKIADNDKQIVEFNEQIANEKSEAKAEYKEKLAVIEQKNRDMKVRMDGYQDGGKDDWTKFKSEFNRDMNELGQAFKNLTIRGTK